MRIDNRFFIPFAAPFLLLGLSRSVWWVAGATWNADTAAALSMFVGFLSGIFFMAVLFSEEISIGHITIGKHNDD